MIIKTALEWFMHHKSGRTNDRNKTISLLEKALGDKSNILSMKDNQAVR